MDKTIVLLSGGVDSSLCLLLAHRAGTVEGALQINYDQPCATNEREAAAKLCAELDIERTPMRAYHPGRAAMWLGVGAPGPRVVPGRNLWLLSLAISHAAALGANSVTIGCNADDAENYPDCRPEFLAAVSSMAQAAYGVSVKTPLLHMTKRQVIGAWRELGRNLDETWSCYESTTTKPCGTCNACVLRAESA